MRVGIVGLGTIGGSFAKAIKTYGDHTVLGLDRNSDAIAFAKFTDSIDGVLTEEGLAPAEIREMVHIAHSEGFAVMAHGNGTVNVLAAAEAGVDSVEHGAYLHQEALCAMKEAGTVWVPTLSTVGNLRGKGRFSEKAVQAILESALCNVSTFSAMGGLLAPGTDAGAWAVPHAAKTEYALMEDFDLSPGIQTILDKF